MELAEFNKLYKSLNKAQKEAVDTIEGPVMVVAGPGTGKTQILTLRIANILLKTHSEPENILALTFTESGVQSMRKRLASIIGSPAYAVEINTFHGFSNDIIKNNPEAFPHIIGSRSITDVEQISLVQQIIEKSELKVLKPSGDTLYFVRAVMSAIQELKREGVFVEDFEKIVKNAEKQFSQIPDLFYESGAHKGKMKGAYKDQEKQIAKNKELSFLYKEYEQELRRQKLYDYNDMITETLRALRKDADLLLRLQEQYHYILVDEHQDTNNAQNKILELLASHFAPRPNLFVVGDEKQSIFRFQGASLENFLYFKNIYPEAILIILTDNYRSTQNILDGAHSLIAGKEPLISHASHKSKPVELCAFSKNSVLNYFIATDIARLVKEGVNHNEIAVLYRNNKDAFAIAEALNKFGIPYNIESDKDIFAEPIIQKLLTILKAIHSYGDDRALALFLHLDALGIPPLDVFKVVRYASQKRKYSLFDIIANKKFVEEVELENPDALINAQILLAHFVKLSHNTNLVDLLEHVLRESGLLESVLSSDTAQDGLDALDSFFDEVRSIVNLKPRATLSDFFSYLDTITTHELFIKRKKAVSKEGFVRLMTAHRSKGLEFEYVYVVYVHDGAWGNRRQIDLLKLMPAVYTLVESKEGTDFDSNDDERRLFYVALTRAKKHVMLCYARLNEEGREQLPSQFITEIDQKLIASKNTNDIEKEFTKNRGVLYGKGLLQNKSLKDKNFISELFLKQGLSVSALNNYLSCPWKYFYRNLIRLPEPMEAHLLFGTAVHEALNFLFKKLREGESVNKKVFLNLFEEKLQPEPFSPEDYKKYLERGREALSGWFDEYSSRWITNTVTEFAIRGIEFDKNIILTGKLDKLEFLSEREVNVVDYKTGKPKTRNQILGKTKEGDAGVWRQLIFYKILLDRFKDGFYEMVSGEIDFIEPKENGSHVKEKFLVTKDDTLMLEDEIRRIAKEILNLEFWDKRCDDKKCEYCKIRNLQKTP